MSLRTLIFAFAFIWCWLPAQGLSDHLKGEKLSGKAIVLSGGMLVVGKRKIKLLGLIEIPLTMVPWGPRARLVLQQKTKDKKIVCTLDTHQTDFEIAVCRLGKQDLGAFMIANGLAITDREKAEKYYKFETRAAARRLGFWGDTSP